MLIIKTTNHGNARWRVTHSVKGKRRQRFFSSREDAREWMRLLEGGHNGFWGERTTEEQRGLLPSPVAVAKALGVDLMAENYTLVAGMDFAREVRNSIAEASEDVLGGTRALIQSQLEGLNSAVREIVRGELSRTLESKSARPKPQARMETHRIPSYIPPQVPKGY